MLSFDPYNILLSDDEYRTAIAQKPNISGLQRKVDFTIAKVEAVQTPMTSISPPPGRPVAGSGGGQ